MISISDEKLPHLIYVSLSLLVLGFASVLYFWDNQVFQRFFGRINPPLAFLVVIGLGYIAIVFLNSQGWFTFFDRTNQRGWLYACALGAIFGIIIILADTRIVFSESMNILFPKSLLFYPAIGFFVEILFHVLPLALILSIFKSIDLYQTSRNFLWICIFFVALIEPVYQSMNMAASNRFALWAVLFVGIHVFLINWFELYLFRRYDFMSMYALRLVYYLFWHIGWGHLRLQLLF